MPKKKPNGYKCPRCGNKDKFTRNHEDDLRDNLVVCNKCGQSGKEKLFHPLASRNPFLKAADGYFSDSADKMPANKTDSPTNKNNPQVKHERGTGKKSRKDPAARLNQKIDPTEDENTRRVSMRNPFIKTAKITVQTCPSCEGQEASCEICGGAGRITVKPSPEAKENADKIGIAVGSKNPFTKESQSKKCSKCKGEGKYYQKPNPDDPDVGPEQISGAWHDCNKCGGSGEAKTEASGNPFTKQARDFKRTKQQIERKEDKNMVFPEGEQGLDGEGKTKAADPNEAGADLDDESSSHDRYRQFDTVDRKDPRNSPDPKTFIPGYKEWFEREVDQYYDGWVDDHIENSGGSVPGSNTEKTMNLNEGERNHPPEFPTEAVYEKHLETRHHFNDDYVSIIAKNNKEIKLSYPLVGAFLKKALFEIGPKRKDDVLDLEVQERERDIDQEVEDILERLANKDEMARKTVGDALREFVSITDIPPEEVSDITVLAALRAWLKAGNVPEGQRFSPGHEPPTMDVEPPPNQILLTKKTNPFLKGGKKKTKRNSKARESWWMTGPNSGVGGEAGGDGGGAAASSNPFAKKAKVKIKTENEVRAPFCPKKEDTEEDEQLVHSKENNLYMCPSTGEVFHEEGNNFGKKQPEWKSKEKSRSKRRI